jgi:hypothetical protein
MANPYFTFNWSGAFTDSGAAMADAIRAIREDVEKNPNPQWRNMAPKEEPPERLVNPGAVKAAKPSRFKTDLLDGAEAFKVVYPEGTEGPICPAAWFAEQLETRVGDVYIPIRRPVTGSSFKLDLST